MRETNIRAQLSKLGNVFLREIEAGNSGIIAISARKRLPPPEQTTTGGYRIVLLRPYFPRFETTLEIWIDRWTDGQTYRGWAGLHIPVVDRTLRQKLDDQVTLVGATRVLGPRNLVRNPFVRLKSPLPAGDYLKILVEKERGEIYVGAYHHARIARGANLGKLARDLLAALAPISRLNSLALNTPSGRDDYAAVENRLQVMAHLIRERSTKLARSRKQLDHFICQICGFDFSERYPGVGDMFAEVHHIVALSKNLEKRVTRLSEMTTVCANCHRMLHRMSGRKDDIRILRRIVKRVLAQHEARSER